MPDVNARERQQVKQQSAAMVITDGYISQAMAGAGTLVAVASPIHGAILGLGAALMGMCGNYRQAVANDPARDDFDVVEVAQASLDESRLPSDDLLQPLYRFSSYQLMLSNAFYHLLRSLERYDGAMNASQSEAASLQADAVQQNAETVATLQENLQSLCLSVNEVWDSLRANLIEQWPPLTLEQVQQFYREKWGNPPLSPSVALQEIIESVPGTVDDVFNLPEPGTAHPILSATNLPEAPEPLIDDSYIAGLAQLSSDLRSLVEIDPA